MVYERGDVSPVAFGQMKYGKPNGGGKCFADGPASVLLSTPIVDFYR